MKVTMKDVIELLKDNLDDYSVRLVSEEITSTLNEVKEYLDTIDGVRENVIRSTREIIRRSGWAIVEALKGDLDKAYEHLNICETHARRLLEDLRPYPELLYTGLVNNALSEYVEARLFIDLITSGKLRNHRELGVPPVPYLQGLGDLVGELKRLGLELIRNNEYDLASKLLSIMEAIYLELRTLDYPDALLPGVRHKTDVARRLVDDFKSLLVDLSNRQKLSTLLEKCIALNSEPR